MGKSVKASIYVLALLGFALTSSPEAFAHPAPYRHRHQLAPHGPKSPRPVRRAPIRKRYTYLSVGLLGNFVVPSASGSLNEVIEAGAGASFTWGTRVNAHVAVEVGGLFTFHRAGRGVSFNTSVLAAVTADAKVFLMPRARRIEPFLQIGVGGYFMAREGFNYPLEGVGLQAGGGLDLRLNRAVSLGAKALYRGMYLDNRDAYYGFYPAEQAFLSMFTVEATVTLTL